jgi:hypothetical protein
MAQSVKNKNHPNVPRSDEEHGKAILWKRRGIEDVYFQREALVNFWTVLGGIAVAALLTQMNNLIDSIRMGRWYLLLYFFTTVTLIVHSWVQNLWGGLVLRVRVTMLHTFILLMDLICLAVMCLQVTNPLIFFAAGGSYVLFAIFLLVYLMKSGAMVDLSPGRINGNKATIWTYLVFMILCLGAVANLFWVASVAAEIGWGVFALLASVAAMFMQHYGMKQERKELGIP